MSDLLARSLHRSRLSYGAQASSSSQFTQARGAKQLSLAKKAGVAKGYISSLESGEKKNPGIQTLKKLARALGVPVGGAAGMKGKKPSRGELLRPSDIAGVLCGWLGCNATTEYVGGPVPQGWRSLVISKQSLLEPAAVMTADRDMMLCPAHVQSLKLLLKQIAE
jgi:transcriptional regulator with XRE-family HTH domain